MPARYHVHRRLQLRAVPSGRPESCSHSTTRAGLVGSAYDSAVTTLTGVVQHLLRNAEWTASRSTGPGGQHRDKASTCAELTIGLDSLTGLEPEVAARLATALALDERPLRISIQDERSLSRNQDLAVDRLTELVARALAPPPPRATRRLTPASGICRCQGARVVGCPLVGRCPYQLERCGQHRIAFVLIDPAAAAEHTVACVFTVSVVSRAAPRGGLARTAR